MTDTPTASFDPPSPPPPPSGSGAPTRRLGRRPARRNPIWLVLGSILVIPMLAQSTYQVVELLAHERETVTSTVEGEGIAAIEVDNRAGPVQVLGTDGDDITVRAEVSHGLRRTERTLQVDGDRLVVRSSCPNFGSSHCAASYRIEVPRHLAADVRSSDGRLDVRDVGGPVAAHSGNGAVEVAGAGEAVEASSRNGRVEVTGFRGSHVSASSRNGAVRVVAQVSPRQVDASSRNGDVEVMVRREEGVAYAVDLSTRNGEQRNEVASDPASDRRIALSSGNGSVTTRYG